MGKAALAARRARQLDVTKILDELPVPPQAATSAGDERAQVQVQVRLAQRIEGKRAQQAVFDLFEGNMRACYEGSSMGWNERSKRRELFHSSSRFILLEAVPSPSPSATHQDASTQVAPSLVGFCIFRFDTEECEDHDPSAREGEDEVEVAYCYELQVAPSHRGTGLGAYLLSLLESLGRAAHMRKAMLTVFTCNEGARRFYAREGYSPDPISPRPSHGMDYEILSKRL